MKRRAAGGAVVVDHQVQRRPIGQDRLREELGHHVRRQPARRARRRVVRPVGVRPTVGGSANDANVEKPHNSRILESQRGTNDV